MVKNMNLDKDDSEGIGRQHTLGWVIIPSNAVKYTITRRLYAHMHPKAHSYMYFCAWPPHIALHCHYLMAKTLHKTGKNYLLLLSVPGIKVFPIAIKFIVSL